MTSHLGNRQKLKEGMPLGNLSTVAFHAAKVPTNVFSSTLIFHLMLDYYFIKDAILSATKPTIQKINRNTDNSCHHCIGSDVN